ncbi:MAG: hypothetical protein KIC55_06005 [Lachnoanaerobaculum sp.]|jgi:hypothetical protein|uniref:hypothetical protein n=1 Tax=Lachnoanaerobaculum TaxID=1164882 RepID=UPI0025B9B98A|nr:MULTISPECIES: hypothetical protein [unclassified Lachnoanaerobaculum]MBS5881941.1 hypothetical protein [Lachnoanaerobaculum sp.]GMO03090.1 hypothetical protein LSA36186_13390 [Lachnoanaerobaculum sp. JCM 36186]
MRRLFTVTLGILCVASIMGCGAKANNTESQATTASQESTLTKEAEEISETNESTPITGGWAINNDFDGIDDANAMSAFEKATEDLDGYRYDVAAVLGSQIVAGTNYLYLCRAEMVVPDAKPEYVILKVYEDLEGNAEITGSLRLLEGKEGWEYNDANPYMDENEEVKVAFDKALEGLTGVEYKPIAYIGYKDNSYAVLTKITITSVEPLTSLSMVYITKTDSGAMIDDIYDIDMSLENVGEQ